MNVEIERELNEAARLTAAEIVKIVKDDVRDSGMPPEARRYLYLRLAERFMDEYDLLNGDNR